MKISAIVFLYLFALILPLHAQEFGDSDLPEGSHQVISFEYLDGIYAERAINSYQLSAAYGKYVTRSLALYGQFTLARNNSYQVNWFAGPAQNRGSTHGVALSVLARYNIVKTDDYNITANASAGIIYFNERFPAFGTRLNALLKTGLSAGYRVSGPWYAELGVNYMHVSNGKGQTIRNPALDSIGPSIALARQF